MMSRSELGYYVFRTPEKTVLQELAAELKAAKLCLNLSTRVGNLTECSSSLSPRDAVFGMCRVASLAQRDAIHRSLASKPTLEMARSKVKGELCFCPFTTDCCNHGAVRNRIEHGLPRLEFGAIKFQNTLASILTLADFERMRENSKKREAKAESSPSVANTIRPTDRKTRKSSDSGISVSPLPLNTLTDNVPLAPARRVRIRKRARKDDEESEEEPELVEMAVEPCQQCKECSLWIKRNKLLPHACKHGDQQRFRCSNCEYQGATYAAGQKHINRCHKNERVKIFDWTRDKSFCSYKREMMEHCFPDPARYHPKSKHSRWQRRCVLRNRLDHTQPSSEPREDVVDQPFYDPSELFDNYKQCRL